MRAGKCDDSRSRVFRLGVVSFLNARPLIEGLEDHPAVSLGFDVPARLPGLLDSGAADAALIPIVDLLRRPDEYQVVSDACIACDGETMTVRVFAQVPPDRIRTLWTDVDSHTSVALARVLWRELYGQELELRPLDYQRTPLDGHEAALLIGDKVVDPQRGSFAYEVDLGGVWRQHTGLPFVFAVWAARRPADRQAPATAGKLRQAGDSLAAVLSAARDCGVAQAAEIAQRDGPRHGWPVELARRYLTRCMKYKLDARAVEGAALFTRHCVTLGIVPGSAAVAWPEAPAAVPVGAKR